MINRFLECVNDSNNVYKIEADAGIKIRSEWHTYYKTETIKFSQYFDRYTCISIFNTKH